MTQTLTFELCQKEEQIKGNKESWQKNEEHRSSSPSPVDLVSGWLRITGAQVSVGAASLCPPPPTHTQIKHVSPCFFTFFERADSVGVPQLEHSVCLLSPDTSL